MAGGRALLLDGLDEVQAWRLRPYLNCKLGGMRVIASVRDRGQNWVSVYGFPAGQTQHFPLGGLTRSWTPFWGG